MKLTQNQRTVLSSACENKQGAATRPIGLKAWLAAKMASALIDKGLVKEVRAKGSMPIWREDEEGRGYALKILKAGREALTGNRVANRVAEADAATCTEEETSLRSAARSSKARRSRQNEQAQSSPSAGIVVQSPRAGSKQALVVAMLCEKSGATLGDLVSATGWLPHTTRAALTGLRKKGFHVGRERQEGSPSIYRIMEEACEAAA